MKYNYEDVIIDPDDVRVRIGDEYWFGASPYMVMKMANEDAFSGRLEAIFAPNAHPFKKEGDDVCFMCMIKRNVGYKPYDLSNENDRRTLMGKWIIDRRERFSEKQIIGFTTIYKQFKAQTVNINYTAEELFENFTFLDGTPVGKKNED